MKYTVYDKQGNCYSGQIMSPDGSVQANSYVDVMRIIKRFGLLAIMAGATVMFLPEISVARWAFYQPN